MQPSFSRPSADPAFTEQLKPKEKEMLSTLLGEQAAPPAETGQVERKKAPTASLRAVPTPSPKDARVKEDRSHRTTVWLSPTLQRQIRIRALERDQTVSGYLRELLERDGIVDKT